MQLREITVLITNKLSPKMFRMDSEIYGLHYDKSNCNKLIKRVMLTVDLSLEAIHFALKQKVNLIISNHSLFNNPIRKFKQNLINKLSLLSKYPISIFVLNSSFIAAEGGVSDTLVNALYLKIENVFEIKSVNGIKIPIGRICSPIQYLNKKHSFTLENLIQRIKINLNLNSVPFVGDLKKQIYKICIVGGHISDVNSIKKAMNLGCDCYISGKIEYFDAVFARDMGLSLIETSQYKTEIIAAKKLCNILSLEFPEVEFLLFESKNPINYYL
ncbi:MAG: Nif3-like dinuclear metal center hexameric protein [Candidatus Hodarchaeota archaeon]